MGYLVKLQRIMMWICLSPRISVACNFPLIRLFKDTCIYPVKSASSVCMLPQQTRVVPTLPGQTLIINALLCSHGKGAGDQAAPVSSRESHLHRSAQEVLDLSQQVQWSGRGTHTPQQLKQRGKKALRPPSPQPTSVTDPKVLTHLVPHKSNMC